MSAARVGEQRAVVEAVVLQVVGGQLVHRRRRDRAAEGARRAEAHIIGQDQQHVRRAFGCLDLLGEVGRRVLNRPADLALERRLRDRQHVPRRLRFFVLGENSGQTAGCGKPAAQRAKSEDRDNPHDETVANSLPPPRWESP